MVINIKQLESVSTILFSLFSLLLLCCALFVLCEYSGELNTEVKNVISTKQQNLGTFFWLRLFVMWYLMCGCVFWGMFVENARFILLFVVSVLNIYSFVLFIGMVIHPTKVKTFDQVCGAGWCLWVVGQGLALLTKSSVRIYCSCPLISAAKPQRESWNWFIWSRTVEDCIVPKESSPHKLTKDSWSFAVVISGL